MLALAAMSYSLKYLRKPKDKPQRASVVSGAENTCSTNSSVLLSSPVPVFGTTTKGDERIKDFCRHGRVAALSLGGDHSDCLCFPPLI